MATATWPFNGKQIGDEIASLAGKTWPTGPDGGTFGLSASYTENLPGGGRQPGAIWEVVDPSGTFTDAEIQAGIDAVTYDEDYGRDQDRVALEKLAYQRAMQIANVSGNFTVVTASVALKTLARIVAQLVRAQYARNEQVVEP